MAPEHPSAATALAGGGQEPPAPVAAAREQGLALIRERRWGEAVALLAIDPHHAGAHHNLGVVFHRRR